MNDRVVLGIHSHVSADTEGSGNRFIDGHAWISVTRNGHTEYFGLWPDDHPNVPDNGRGSDIRRGLEAGYPAAASRYYQLDDAQLQTLQEALGENVSWRYTNTCASWASETVERVTGERVNANDTLGFETPRKLVESIRELERGERTSPDAPRAPEPARQPGSSSFGGLYDQVPVPPEADLQTQLARLLDDPARQQAWSAQVEGHRQDLDARQQQQQQPQQAAQDEAARAPGIGLA